MATAIGTDLAVFTVIFSFEVESEDQQRELMKTVTDIVKTIVSKQPGFRSANLHRSLDGTKVVNYLQFKDKESFLAFKGNDQLQSQIQPRIAPFGPSAAPYEVVLSVTH